MSSNVADHIVKIYKSLALIPSLVEAKLVSNGTAVNTVWSQRNLERGKVTKFFRTISITPQLTSTFNSIPIDVSNELLFSISPSEKFRAVLREISEKQYLEIWQSSSLHRVVDLTALDLHGNIYTDGEFGTFRWSSDENKLLYIAEFKPPKQESFYKRAGKKDKTKEDVDDGNKTVGEEYLYKQDWGEQLVGKKKSVVVQYDVSSDTAEVLNGIPENVCPAQVVYSADSSYVIGIAYEVEPRKLGLIYCSNRPSTIFTLDFNGQYDTLLLNNKSVRSPIVTPDGKTLLWLQRVAGGPHADVVSLMKTSLPINEDSAPITVVESVNTSLAIENGRKFYGLYSSKFAKRCFASGNRLVISTNQVNTVNTYVIDYELSKITELQYDGGSQVVLDVVNDIVLVGRLNYFSKDYLAIGKLPPKGSEASINWQELTSTEVISGLENSICKYMDLTHDTQDTVKTFSAIYLGPKTTDANSTTLIVWPHGGPHSAFANQFSIEASMFLLMGYAVLFVNYRGSIGRGQDNVEFLPGKVGDADASDCILATNTALKENPVLNPNSLVLVGGSHGGFLVTSLSGQYPDMFKAVVARNPVIDVASMSTISDIPDWCYVEAGLEYTQIGAINDELLLKMRKASPIEHAHKVKAPTLLQIGSKDLRVPPHQGIEYYHRLKANGVTVRMNLYEDNHPLALLPHEMDNLINSVLWIEKYRI